jgi:GTP-binding protein
VSGGTTAADVQLTRTGLPVVAIVGRPNVGKSTLVNRLIGRREAIVEDRPGVTRDRKEFVATWRDRQFCVVDTGGWLATSDPLAAKVTGQAEKAMRAADVIIFVVDTVVGPTGEDEAISAMLHRVGRPVFIATNKADNEAREVDKWQFMSLGHGEPIAISALHGSNTGDLLDLIVDELQANGAFDVASGQSDDASADERTVLEDEQFFDDDFLESTIAESDADDEYVGEGDLDEVEKYDGKSITRHKVRDASWIPAVAIVGRPNVGKSTLFNRMVGNERSVVHDMPGTTRDTVDTLVETETGSIRFLDTAGMRRKSKIDDGTEYYSMVRALQAIDRADAAILVVDATVGVSHQDQRLAERLDLSGTAVVILVNKWEMLDTESRYQLGIDVEDRLGFLSYAPILRGSALTGRGVHKLMPAIQAALEAYGQRVPTRMLNRVIDAAQRAHPAPNAKVLYATQGAVDPPTFTLFASRELPPTWIRYIERKIREELKLGPTPIKIRVRKRGS